MMLFDTLDVIVGISVKPQTNESPTMLENENLNIPEKSVTLQWNACEMSGEIFAGLLFS